VYEIIILKQEVVGRTNLLRHGLYRNCSVQLFFYSLVCIRCRGNVFTGSLPSNDWGYTDGQQGDLINLLLFFQNKEYGLINDIIN
jgi:hypothetical protein